MVRVCERRASPEFFTKPFSCASVCSLVISDLRIAWRSLSRNPAFALTAVSLLALGIGANASIFSVVDQVLLNPAGITDPARIVGVRARYDNLALLNIPLSVPDFADVEASKAIFESAAIERDTLQSGHSRHPGRPGRRFAVRIAPLWRLFARAAHCI